MKQMIRFACCLLLCMALIAANLCTAEAAASFYSQAELLVMKTNFEKDGGFGSFAVAQGACTDGKYAYFAVMQGGGTILKYDINSWKLVASKQISNVGHGNDIAYNPDENLLVIANNEPYYNIVTLIDADTLKVIKDVELKQTVKVKETQTDKLTGKKKTVEKEKEQPLDIYSISYNSELKRYVVGISGSYDFALLDTSFKKKSQFKGVNTGYTRQGCDCDEDYIYFVQSGGSGNLLVIYDYSGKHIASVTVSDSHEIENLFHVGHTFYASFYYYGNTLQRIGFSPATRIAYSVNYSPNGGEGKMEPTVVHYGDATPLRKNTYTKEGYFFGGWKVQRGSDRKIVGYRNGSTKFEWLNEDDVYDLYLYEDGKKVATTVKNGSVLLSAFWINKEYEISFDCGEGEGEMEPVTAGYSAAFAMPKSQFTKEGYIFDGYTAYRNIDRRVYGFRKNSDKPEWLKEKDAAVLYHFREGELFSRMTYDGSVTLTAQFQYAYDFSDDKKTLQEYVGVDEKVKIPDNGGELTTIAEGAFHGTENMTELYVPASVEAMERDSVSKCPKLKTICFEGNLPEKLDNDSVRQKVTPILYREYDGMDFCIGFYANAENVPLIKCHAAAVEKNIEAHVYDKQ